MNFPIFKDIELHLPDFQLTKINYILSSNIGMLGSMHHKFTAIIRMNYFCFEIVILQSSTSNSY